MKCNPITVEGDPFLFADWERVLFFHFVIEPSLLRSHVPPPFDLELYNGQAGLSLVCVTMRKFRPCRFDPAAFPFGCIREQRFLNLRTYVRCRGEPGALFLHGWLSKPAPLPLPSSAFSLPYTFANLVFEHAAVNGPIRGAIRDGGREFAYAGLVADLNSRPTEPGSLAEFVMERYSGFFARRNRAYVFRAWHPVWMQKPVHAKILRDDLIKEKLAPWPHAQFAGASLADTISRVELGKAHRIDVNTGWTGHKALSRMFETP